MKKQIAALLAFCGMLTLSAKPEILGETNNPKNSVFAMGEKVELTFTATGLKPNEKTTLILNIVDEKDTPVKNIVMQVQADEKGNWKGITPAPCDKFGFYRVWGKLADGTILPKVFTRPEGFITYAVVYGEKRYKEYPLEYTFWGNHGPSHGYHRQIGLRWGGASKNFNGLEPKKAGEYTENPNADKIQLMADFNKTFKEYRQTTLHGYPKWFLTPKYVKYINNKWSGYTPEGGAYLQKFWDKFAVNYEKQILENQPFGLIQITWEPMFPWAFGGTPKDLVEIHKYAYPAIHKNTKHIKVMGPASAGLNTVDWHIELFKEGLLKYIDVLSIHPYFAFPPEQNGMVRVIRQLKAAIREYNNGKDMPIIGNESGFATAERKELENVQMYGIVRANLILLGEGFKYNLIFYAHDYEGEPGYGYTYNLNKKRNWGADKVGPKPVFPAIGGASYFTNGHISAGAIEYLGDTAWGYAYQRQDGFVTLALWDYSGNPREVEIPVGRNEIVIGDMMGNTKKVKTNKGILKLTLTEAPVYVVDANPDIWGRNAVKKIVFQKEKINGVAGSKLVLKGKLNAAKKELNGTLIVEFPKNTNLKTISKTFKVAAGKEQNFELSAMLPKQLRSGGYPLIAKFISNGVTEASTGVLLNVQPPVKISNLHPVFKDGKAGLSFTLKDLSEMGQSGKMEVRIAGNPEGRIRQTFQLKPGENKQMNLFYDSLETNPLKEEQIEVTLRTADGVRVFKQVKLNLLGAKKRSTGDWKNVSWGTLTRDMKKDDGNISTKADDLTGKIAFAWNDKYLMFRAVTVDDVYCQPYTGWRTWSGDCIQMGLTKAYRPAPTGNAYQDKMDLAYSEIDFALTSKGPEVYRTVTFDEKALPIAPVDLNQAPLTVDKEILADGKVKLTYTGCIPWSFLNIPQPKAGMILGIGMTFNDRDNAKSYHKYDLEVFRLKRPDLFGALVLE